MLPKGIHISTLGIATWLLLVAVPYFLSGCGTQEKERIDAVVDRGSIPTLEAFDVLTIVSDSGITRYRISAEVWQVYDKASQPYWDFPEGIYLETFDSLLNVTSSVRGDYAKFLENEQIWELKGNVSATNIDNEVFETEQLFWDQKTERIYSDSSIVITRQSSIINGIGFESNQSMTNYTIRNPKGIIPIRDDEEEEETQQTELGEERAPTAATDVR